MSAQNKPATAKKFKVKTRLSTLAFTPGGILAKDALARADVAIENMRGPALAAIDVALTAMETRFSAANSNRDNEPPDDLYDLSANIIDVCGVVRDTGIDQGAKALCDLVDLSGELGVWDWEAVDLHISTLRMLRSGGEALGVRERAALIDGLLKVTRKRIGDPKNVVPAA